MKIPISEHVVYMNCFECQIKKNPICVHNMLLACSELVDARIRASEKDLPVQCVQDRNVCPGLPVYKVK